MTGADCGGRQLHHTTMEDCTDCDHGRHRPATETLTPRKSSANVLAIVFQIERPQEGTHVRWLVFYSHVEGIVDSRVSLHWQAVSSLAKKVAVHP